MQRIKLVLALVAVMVMLVALAAPAMARPHHHGLLKHHKHCHPANICNAPMVF